MFKQNASGRRNNLDKTISYDEYWDRQNQRVKPPKLRGLIRELYLQWFHRRPLDSELDFHYHKADLMLIRGQGYLKSGRFITWDPNKVWFSKPQVRWPGTIKEKVDFLNSPDVGFTEPTSRMVERKGTQ